MKSKGKRIIVQFIMVLAILFGGMAMYGADADANPKNGVYANAAEVLYYWETLTNIKGRWESNHQYKVIYYTNGYDYTQSKKNITSAGDRLLGNSRYAYTRVYRTY